MMITHYLKTAFRSLSKYKQQVLISVLGMSVGFVCFALSTVWNRYELSFDNFHSASDRIYLVTLSSEKEEKGFLPRTPYPLAAHLKDVFPEVEEACRVDYIEGRLLRLSEGREVTVKSMPVDTNFFHVFDVSFNERTSSLLSSDESVILSENFALEVNPGTGVRAGDMLSKNTDDEKKYMVDAVVKSWPKNTNFVFDMLVPIQKDEDWSITRYMRVNTYIKVKEGTDTDAFTRKIEAYKVPSNPDISLQIMPLKDVYHSAVIWHSKVKHEYILIFSVAGLLVMLCALFNYLTLFINNLRGKAKELVLRKVNGATDRQLLYQLLAEILLMLFVSLMIGFLMIEWIYPYYNKFAVMNAYSKSQILFEVTIYAFVVVLGFILISLFSIYYFRGRSVQEMLHDLGNGPSRKTFTRICLGLQFTIGLFFFFCTMAMFWQVHYLTHTDLGFDRRNISTVPLFILNDQQKEALLSEMQTIPEIEEMAVLSGPMFLPDYNDIRVNVQTDNGGSVELKAFNARPEIFSLMNIRLLEGEKYGPGREGVVLNEAAYSLLGESYAPGKGKTVKIENNGTVVELPVLGIARNTLYASPLVKAEPSMFTSLDGPPMYVCFRYQEGTRWKTEKSLRKISESKLNFMGLIINDMSAIYDDFLQSEYKMMYVLGAMTILCVIIAIFGIYSMVSLSCEQRRKEIAIRKVNGAGSRGLLKLFISEYFYVLVIAALFAFPLGYNAIQPWIEKYINQVRVGLGMYAIIFAFVALLTVITIVSRIWRVLRANPAEELKRE